MNTVDSCSTEYVFNEDMHANVVKVTIDLSEYPWQLLDCDSQSGYYRDQVVFFALEPNTGDEFAVTIVAIIRIGINPGYDQAAESLLGHELWALFSDDDVDDIKAQLTLRQNFVLTDKDAQLIVNRLMLNSTFS